MCLTKRSWFAWAKCAKLKSAGFLLPSTMNSMHIVISFFNTKSRGEFMSGSRLSLGSRTRVPSCPAGTIVMLYDLDAQEAWAVCSLKNWDGTDSPCREHHLLDEDTYSADLAKYNRYDICIKSMRILTVPILFEEIRTLVGGGDQRGAGNMWRGFHGNFQKPFQSGADPSCVQRFCLWAKSLI